MSKFTVKLKLQGLEIEVEGTKEDAPRIAQKIGQQLGGLLQAPAMLASGNGNPVSPVIKGQVWTGSNGNGKKHRTKKAGGGGSKSPAEELNFVHDPSKYGSPQQSWTTIQKAIWFLYAVAQQAQVVQLTAYNIAKNFNKHFKAAGQINAGNVMKGLEKEKLRGTNATVGADMSDGTAKYFLTQAGTALAEKLLRGEAVTTTD